MFYPKSPFLSNREVESHLILGNNDSRLQELLEWLCLTPRITTYRVNLLRSTRQAFILTVEAELERKYPTATPAIYPISQIPEVVCLNAFSSPHDCPHPNPQLREVVVDVCCAAALLRGAHIYAPGVLAMEAGTQIGEKVQVYADLEGRCKKGTNIRYESESKVFIGHGTVRMQRYQLYGAAEKPHCGVAVEMKNTISGVPSLGDLTSCDALLQNFPSIVCVRVLDPKPSERVLDMCAAPGNKTTHIAELMHDEGTLVALDKSESKIKRLRDKISNLGLRNVYVNACDATTVYENSAERFTNEPPFTAATFDRVLLDAPCSALGNRPLLAAKITPKMLASYPRVQKKLFETAVPLLKPGGVMVYSTCTITTAENEAMVAWALNTFPELELMEAIPRFGASGLSGAGLDEEQRHCVQRFGPVRNDDQDEVKSLDTVGFFIAKFRKFTFVK